MKIKKNSNEVKKILTSSKIASNTLTMIEEHIKPGITTNDINILCHNFIIKKGGFPATLNYKGFPKSICTSVNHQVCHGIPGKKKLKNGDIINIDVAVVKDGFYGDTSKMFFVGKPSIIAKRLCKISQECLYKAINEVKPGAYLGNIGYVIQKHAEKNGFSVVRDYCGHGIGKNFHEFPQILHYGKKNEGLVIEDGMIFTIEPMINSGKEHTKVLLDNWTVVTKDHSLSSQWEHTIHVKKKGFEILTLRQEENLSDIKNI